MLMMLAVQGGLHHIRGDSRGAADAHDANWLAVIMLAVVLLAFQSEHSVRLMLMMRAVWLDIFV